MIDSIHTAPKSFDMNEMQSMMRLLRGYNDISKKCHSDDLKIGLNKLSFKVPPSEMCCGGDYVEITVSNGSFYSISFFKEVNGEEVQIKTIKRLNYPKLNKILSSELIEK